MPHQNNIKNFKKSTTRTQDKKKKNKPLSHKIQQKNFHVTVQHKQGIRLGEE